MGLLVAVSACSPTAETENRFVAVVVPTSALARVAAGARRCWFANDPRFSGYALLDERDSRSQRLLVVRRADPQGRPAMVIEDGADGLEVYGPLANARLRAEARGFVRSRGRRCA